MMRNPLYISFFLGAVLFFASCKNDVASALLKGEQIEYNFTNDVLEDRFVDEGLVEQFSLTSDNDGNKAKIEAVYIGSQANIKTDTIILYLHGNLASMNDYWQLAVNQANVGGQHRFGVMMFDYRGFGNSEGESKDITDLVSDAEACIDWLTARGLTKDRLIIYGFSLGAMPAAHLAATTDNIEVEKIVLEAPQTTSTVLLQDATGLSLPGSSVTSFNYDIPLVLKDYSGYMHWLHGTEDETANYENFKKVYDEYQNPNKGATIVEGAGHNTTVDMGFDEFEKMMLNIIQR